MFTMADSWQAPNQPTFNKSTTILLSDGGHRYPGTAMTKTRTKMPPAIRLCRRGAAETRGQRVIASMDGPSATVDTFRAELPPLDTPGFGIHVVPLEDADSA